VLKQATEHVSAVSMKIGEAMYKAQSAAGSPPPDGGPHAPGGDNVVDAEFEEVDDKKKSA